MPTTRLAAIMFTDIVGYTAMMEDNREAAMEAIKTFETVLKDRIQRHSGDLVQTYGDGSLSVFDSASAAVLCAKEIQEEIRETVPLRIGIHLGEITRDGDHTFGDGVNIASRIESMGIPGAVLMSSAIRQQIKNNPVFQLQPLGEFAFKNVAEPMTVYGLANEGFVQPKPKEVKGKAKFLSASSQGNNTFWKSRALLYSAIGLLFAMGAYTIWNSRSTSNSEAIEKSIAVLPFADMSKAKDQAYLGDGIAEEVLNLLTQIPELKTTSRSSAFSFKDKDLPLPQIAQQLGVAHILEGSVNESNNQVRISVKLVDAKTDQSIWSQSWNRKLEDVFAIQDEISTKIVSVLRITLMEEEANTRKIINPQAYQLYLQSNYYSIQEGGGKKALELIQHSLKIDSTFVPAWSQLCRVYVSLASGSQHGKTYLEWSDLARSVGKKTINIDPDFAGTYGHLGQLYTFNYWKFDSARFYINKARELDPGSAGILNQEGVLDILLGNEAGIPRLKQALALNPISSFWSGQLGMFLYRSGRHKEAETYLWPAVSKKENFFMYDLVALLLKEDRIAEADSVIQLMREDFFSHASKVMLAHAKEGSIASNRYFEELTKRFDSGYYYQIAEVTGFLGDKDLAFEWLERSYSHHDPGSVMVFTDPLFDHLHDDPRWLPFIKKMGFPE